MTIAHNNVQQTDLSLVVASGRTLPRATPQAKTNKKSNCERPSTDQASFFFVKNGSGIVKMSQPTLEQVLAKAPTGPDDPITVGSVVYARRGDLYNFRIDDDNIVDIENESDHSPPKKARRLRSKRTYKRGTVIEIVDKSLFCVKFDDGLTNTLGLRSLKKEYAMLKHLTIMEDQERAINISSLEIKKELLDDFQSTVYKADHKAQMKKKLQRIKKEKLEASTEGTTTKDTSDSPTKVSGKNLEEIMRDDPYAFFTKNHVDLTGNDDLEHEGERQETAGKLKDKVDDAGDKVNDAIDSVKDRLD